VCVVEAVSSIRKVLGLILGQ